MEIRTEGRRDKPARKFELSGKLDDDAIARAISKARDENKTLRIEDGQGLRLIVTPKSARWVLRYVSTIDSKRRDMGLGALTRVDLATARAERERIRVEREFYGKDPLEQRRRGQEAERKARADEQSKAARASATLESVAKQYHGRISAQFRNDKHRAQWLASLENHVFETLGDRPISTIEAEELLDLLVPLRDSVPETARRIRQRLDAIFEDAIFRKLADRNPAQAILRKMREGATRREETHFAALNYADVPDFVAKLRAFERVGIATRRALEWTILTGARTGETLGAKWGEIDVAKREWRVPGSRMKSARSHRVPLTARALEILKEVRPLGEEGGYVFPSPLDRRQPLSNMAMAMGMRRLDFGYAATVHGFRQCLSTWARERTKYRIDTIEAALAHRDEDKVARAYSHAADYWDERRALAETWTKFCTTPPAKEKPKGNVVPMDGARRARR